MSKVTLYSQMATKLAYPSAAFTAPDMRSMLGLYAFGGVITPSTVVSSRGYLEMRVAQAGTVEVSDG